MKLASDIKKWGFVKPFFDKKYKFNSIDIEPINNKLFILGYIINGKYSYVESDFYNVFNDLLIENARGKCDILTWSKYDNTHLLKLLLKNVDIEKVNRVLLRIGKISPVYTYQYKNFEITIVNILK
jgi:hypothetical protein